MALRKRQKTRECLAVINDYKTEKFPEKSQDEEEIEDLTFSSIWRHPERICSSSDDFSFFLSYLHRENFDGNYENVLKLLKNLKMSYPTEEIDQIFEFLLTQILKDEFSKKIDLHVILDWLDTGDTHFCGEKSKFFKKSTYSLLKFYFLCRNRKAKLEVFSCGCVQKYFIDIYHEKSRLPTALSALISSNYSDLHPIVKRLFNGMQKISEIEYFQYYVELLAELRICSVIDENDGNTSTIIQLIGFLRNLKSEDVPKACFALKNLAKSTNKSWREKPSLMITVLKTTLLPKIFESLGDNSTKKLEVSAENIQKLVKIVTKEDSDQQSAFASLGLLNLIYTEQIWEKTLPFFQDQLNSLNPSCKSFNTKIILMIGLIYHHGISLLPDLVDFLKNQYPNGDFELKSTILNILDFLEKLGETNEKMRIFMEKTPIKLELLMNSPLDSPENVQLALENIQEFQKNPQELTKFLSAKAHLFPEDSMEILLRNLQKMNFYIDSDKFWKILMGKITIKSMNLIINQFKILIKGGKNRKNEILLKKRVDELLEKAKKVEKIVILEFPRFVLSLSDEELSIFPKNIMGNIIAMMIIGYILFFEENGQQIEDTFQLLNQKIGESDLSGNIIEKIEEICWKSKGSQPELSFWESIDFVNFLVKFDQDLINNSQRKSPIRERILEISSVLFENLSVLLREDERNKSFVKIAQIIIRFVNNNQDFPKDFHEKVCIRAIQGFSQFSEGWNVLFVQARILEILTSAKNNERLLEKLMEIIARNEDLLTRMRTKKEFLDLEKLVNK